MSLERELYMSRVNLAQREWALNNVGLTNALLEQCPPSLRTWEWAYCRWLGHMERLTLRAAGDEPSEAKWSLRGVYGVAYSPDGRRLATSGADNSVTLWDVATGKAIRVLRGHTDVVFAVVFSPDGSLIATGSKDTTIRIWDVSTEAERSHATGINSWGSGPGLQARRDPARLRFRGVSDGPQQGPGDRHLGRDPRPASPTLAGSRGGHPRTSPGRRTGR